MGRPSVIDAPLVIARDAEGNPTRSTTVSEKILSAMRAGAGITQAAASANVTTRTVYSWMATGARIEQAAALAQVENLPPPTPTPHEARCVDFLHAVNIAEADWEILQLTTLEQLGRGGIEQLTTTVKVERQTDDKGNPVEVEVERSERRSMTLPDARVIMWRLERRFPDRYRPQVQVEHVGDAGAGRAAELSDVLEAHAQAKAARLIEAAATDVDEPDA